MSIRKDHRTGKWKVDLQLKRGGKRYRRTYDTKADCNQFVNFIKGQTQLKKKEFIEKEDKRLLSEIIDIWYQGRGQELADGERTQNLLDNMVEIIGDIQARRMTISRFNEYKAIKRSMKMGKADNQRTVSDKTLNNHLGYLRAVYNYLIEIDEIHYQNPLEKAKKIKLQERELAYLTQRHINTLLAEIRESCNNPHVLLITKLCLATGARWGEVESRNITHLQNGCIVYSQNKGKKVRSIPINQKLYKEVEAHFDRYGGFSSFLCSFDRALKRSNIRLPRGQSSHVLRHTFCQPLFGFMMNGGNIIVLQRILGHADISMTMRYAKFDPNHFQEAINLNPLSGMDDDTEETTEETEEMTI